MVSDFVLSGLSMLSSFVCWVGWVAGDSVVGERWVTSDFVMTS